MFGTTTIIYLLWHFENQNTDNIQSQKFCKELTKICLCRFLKILLILTEQNNADTQNITDY